MSNFDSASKRTLDTGDDLKFANVNSFLVNNSLKYFIDLQKISMKNLKFFILKMQYNALVPKMVKYILLEYQIKFVISFMFISKQFLRCAKIHKGSICFKLVQFG